MTDLQQEDSRESSPSTQRLGDPSRILCAVDIDPILNWLPQEGLFLRSTSTTIGPITSRMPNSDIRGFRKSRNHVPVDEKIVDLRDCPEDVSDPFLLRVRGRCILIDVICPQTATSIEREEAKDPNDTPAISRHCVT